MSMSDLELLQLVDTVKEKQRGPKGEPGVGISSIEQFDETGFTFRLTDGSFKRINLPAPKDGEAGAVGPSGRQGEKGDSGGPGRDGSQGLPGRDGQDGLPGSSIETAVVNSNGHLLLGISDNSIIDVGRVVGPAGATGAVGATGLAGESGKDGAAVLSGPRGPQADDGIEGDHWIDISSAEFSFYKKNGEGWNKLAELRQVPRDLRVPTSGTGGGGGGGGNGGLQNTRTLPLVNGGSTVKKKAAARDLPPPIGAMDTQEDANLYFLELLNRGGVHVGDFPPDPPNNAGQLWFSTLDDELTLYIYTGAVWVVASPPVSLAGIEASVAGIQDYIDTHVTPALAGATGDIRTLEAETAKLNAPNVFNKSNVFRDKDDQQLFVIQEGGVGGQNTPKVQYYGMTLDDWDVVNKQAMDKAIDQAAGSSNAAKLDEDNVFSENNEFLKPVKVAEGTASSHATTNAQLGRHKVELDNSINDLQGQVDVLDGRVDANGDALGDLEQKNTDQDAQIDENTQKIDALSRTAASGVWRYQSYGDAVKADDGEFTLWKDNQAQPVRDWTDAKGMTIASLDDGGINHDITAWVTGDHVEMYEQGGLSFAIYVIGGGPSARPGQVSFSSCLRYSGTPLDRVQYRFRIFDGSLGIDLDEADERYLQKSGGKMTGQLAICLNNNSNAIYLPNNIKADQVSTIRVDRPYSGPNGINSDGSSSPAGRGGLNFDIAGASDQNKVRFRGGQGLNKTLLDITGVNNWKNIKAYSAIGLYGGDNKETQQAIYASSGQPGHLCYSGISEGNQRLSWGSSKVWVRNATLDLTDSKIIHVADPTDPQDAVNLQTLEQKLTVVSAPHPGLGLNWEYSASNGEEPQKGHFSITSNKWMHIHPVPHYSPCGTDFVQLCQKDRGAHDCRTIMTIYVIDGNTGKYNIQVTYQVYRIRYGYSKSNGSPACIQVEYDDTASVYSPSNGRDYFITIGGLF